MGDKIDSNQTEIVKALRKLGISVSVNHNDILCGYAGRTYWFEVKNPGCVSPKTGEIRPSNIKVTQYKLLETWKGHYSIVHSLEQILQEIGLEV